MLYDPNGADRLVEVLCEIPLRDWRGAALITAAAPGWRDAICSLERALTSANPVRLWELYDDLDTALYRLSTDEATGIVRGARERKCICDVSRRAVGALVAAPLLSRTHVDVLTTALVRLVPSTERRTYSSGRLRPS